MENRNKYFLRQPVEYRIQLLIDAFLEMSKEYKKNQGVGIAYQICGDQLQDLLTQIKRDDNHQIVSLNSIETMKMFGMVSDKILNNKTN